jgi:hypothetical protein
MKFGGMMKKSAIIFILALLAIPTVVYASNSSATQSAAPAAATDADQQTLRIVSDPLLLAVVKASQTEYKVKCHVPTLKTADKLIKWTCLNNMACAYNMTVPCYSTRAPYRERVEITVSGYDDGDNEIDSFKFKAITQ